MINKEAIVDALTHTNNNIASTISELKPIDLRTTTSLMINRTFDQQILKTSSYNHQFVRLRGKAVKKYIKNILGILSARRNDFWNSAESREGLLDVFLKTSAKDWDSISDLPMRYEDNVIELYSEDDIAIFEALNESTILSGAIIPYQEELNYVYAASKAHISKDSEDGITDIFILTEKTKAYDHDLPMSTMEIIE
jgi:hypothetical protein